MRVSPSSRWVVLPTVLAAAVVATGVAWVGSSAGGSSGGDQALTSVARPVAPAATADPTGSAAPRPSTASRDKRQAVVPPAIRFQPAPRPPRKPLPPRPTRSMPSSSAPSMPSAPGSPPSAPTTAPGSGGVTAQVVALTNAERAKVGCGALTVNGTLTAVAQAHSQDMGDHNYFDHNSQDGKSPFDRMTAAGYRFSTAAENIAAGQRTPQDVMTSWMNSPGHKANILNCALHQIGVGYATVSGSQYGVYWTQDFGTPL
ncbi:MAG TPA: CAP domain-containing protein [Mycobacteriales bacterium]|jgi:uncharacterized protein YkwD|nr:CAP domain-containing protein [Mycobacteriales bacterium]